MLLDAFFFFKRKYDFFFSLSYTYQIKDRAIAYSGGIHHARKDFRAVHLRAPLPSFGIHAVPGFGNYRLGYVNPVAHFVRFMLKNEPGLLVIMAKKKFFHQRF